MKKVKTIKLQGKEYAPVADRIKEFREACPNGLIETSYKRETDGTIVFKTRILKDKANPSSAEGIGHSMGLAKDDKNFEKLETVSIGRALAILGYMSSGEIASSDEMMEFLDNKEKKRIEKIQDIKDEVDKIKTIKELREYFKTVRGFGIEVDSYIIERSKVLKEDKKKTND